MKCPICNSTDVIDDVDLICCPDCDNRWTKENYDYEIQNVITGKYIGTVTCNDIATLEVLECICGYHIGIDGSYDDQVGHNNVRCPSCNHLINVTETLDDHVKSLIK